jgi:hypothetical protein
MIVAALFLNLPDTAVAVGVLLLLLLLVLLLQLLLLCDCCGFVCCCRYWYCMFVHACVPWSMRVLFRVCLYSLHIVVDLQV